MKDQHTFFINRYPEGSHTAVKALDNTANTVAQESPRLAGQFEPILTSVLVQRFDQIVTIIRNSFLGRFNLQSRPSKGAETGDAWLPF